MKADLCPVCMGSGKREGEQCHGCGGLGWVTVPECRYMPVIVTPYVDPCPNPYYTISIPGNFYREVAGW